MELTARLRAFGAALPRPFVIAAAGSTEIRLAVEAELARRGWAQAASPAETNLLVLCGGGGEVLAPYIERVWGAIAAPRARVQVATAPEVAQALDAAQRRLRDGEGDELDGPAALGVGHDERHGGRPGHGGGPAHGMPDHGGEHGADGGSHAQHRGHGGHSGHGGHDMAGMEVAGLRLAERAEDRDGLKLDRLHVPLGPALPAWPAGLVVRTILQGDVVQCAEVESLVPAETQGRLPFWDEPWLRAEAGDDVARGEAERRRGAAHLDSLARLLVTAGWSDAAARARRLRDQALGGAPARELRRAAEPLARHVGRSRPLEWATRALGVVTPAEAEAVGVEEIAGDVTTRCRSWLRQATAALSRADEVELLGPGERQGPRGDVRETERSGRALLSLLPRLVEGAELGGARLIVASVDPDLDRLRVHDGHGGRNG